jgi:hypothetical protein
MIHAVLVMSGVWRSSYHNKLVWITSLCIYFFTGSKSNGHVKAATSATAAAAVSSSLSGINRKRKEKLKMLSQYFYHLLILF